MDFFRNQRKRQVLELGDEFDIECIADPEAIKDDTSILVRNLVCRQNDRDRELILLKYYSGLTFKQISQVLRRPESTIKRDIYRTLHKMEIMLEDSDEDYYRKGY